MKKYIFIFTGLYCTFICSNDKDTPLISNLFTLQYSKNLSVQGIRNNFSLLEQAIDYTEKEGDTVIRREYERIKNSDCADTLAFTLKALMFIKRYFPTTTVEDLQAKNYRARTLYPSNLGLTPHQ